MQYSKSNIIWLKRLSFSCGLSSLFSSRQHASFRLPSGKWDFTLFSALSRWHHCANHLHTAAWKWQKSLMPVVIRGDVSICAETALSSLKGRTIARFACPLLSPSLSLCFLYTCSPHCSHPIVLTSSRPLKHFFSLCHPQQLLSRHRNAGASAGFTTGRISTLVACKVFVFRWFVDLYRGMSALPNCFPVTNCWNSRANVMKICFCLVLHATC